MTNRDDLVHLLVRLGASVNTVPKSIAESSYYKDKISLKDWIDNKIHKLDNQIKPVDPPSMPSITTPPECSRWQKFYKEYQESLKTLTEEEIRKQVSRNEREERERLEKIEKLKDSKVYFVEVKQLIESHGAESMGKFPKNKSSITSPPTMNPNPSYTFLTLLVNWLWLL
jgi:hypothetical protein